MAGEIGVVFNIPQPFTVRTRRLSQVIRLSHHHLKQMAQPHSEDGKKIISNFIQVETLVCLIAWPTIISCARTSTCIRITIYSEAEVTIYADSLISVPKGFETRDARRNTLSQGIAGRHSCGGIFLSSANLASVNKYSTNSNILINLSGSKHNACIKVCTN